MEWIQRLLESGTTPIVTAFLLGLLTAISPCPLATNIAAVGFIGKDIDDKHRVFCNGLLYTAGRILTYAGIGLAFIPLLREGANTYALQKIIGKYGDAIVAPALILIGLFMLFGHRLNLPKFGFSGHCEKIGRHGSWGALLLGILFSLAFCPSSGVFYFGMLIPMAAAEPGGWFLPVVFAIATGMPVVIAAWILAYGAAGVGIFYGRMQIIRKWLARTVGMLFIAVGIYYWIIYFFKKIVRQCNIIDHFGHTDIRDGLIEYFPNRNGCDPVGQCRPQRHFIGGGSLLRKGGGHRHQNTGFDIQFPVTLHFVESEITEYFGQFGVRLHKCRRLAGKPHLRVFYGSGRKSGPAPGHRRSRFILRIADRFQPCIHIGSGIALDREVRKPTVRSCSVPVDDIGRNLDHVTRPQLTGRLSLFLIIPPSGGHQQ